MIFTLLLCIFSLLDQSLSETAFKRSCLDRHRPSTYVSGSCIVLHEGNSLNRSAANTQCITDYNGHLATIYSQAQIDKIAAIIDFTMPAWCDLKRDPADQNAWLHTPSETGAKPKAKSPPWDPNIPNNPATEGDGVVVGKDGMSNQNETAIHPFLCEYGENMAEPANIKAEFYKKTNGLRASNEAALNQFTAKSILGCGETCAETQECKSFAYSKTSAECHLYALPNEALSLAPDTDYELFDKVMKDIDCLSKTDCAKENTHFLFIGGDDGPPNIETYYPLDPSKNGIVATIAVDNLYACMAEWYDGKVMILGGWIVVATWFYDPDTHAVSPGPDMPGVGLTKSASATLNGAVVVCGGRREGSGSDKDVYTCIMFKNNQWTTMPSLNEKRHDLSMVNYKNKLYAVGGYNWDNSGTIERFEPETNTWVYYDTMPIAGDLPGLGVYGELLFSCGGWPMYEKCHTFNEALYQWTQIGSMNEQREDNHLLVFNGVLYTVCGSSDGGDTSNQIKKLEVYNAGNDTWSYVAGERIQKRYKFGAVVV